MVAEVEGFPVDESPRANHMTYPAWRWLLGDLELSPMGPNSGVLACGAVSSDPRLWTEMDSLDFAQHRPLEIGSPRCPKCSALFEHATGFKDLRKGDVLSTMDSPLGQPVICVHSGTRLFPDQRDSRLAEVISKRKEEAPW